MDFKVRVRAYTGSQIVVVFFSLADFGLYCGK